MANWYHCSVKPVSRSAGRSCVAAAAYRIGENLYDERTQTTHDYTRRSGVEESFIIAPANAPEWATDPAHLWNAAEAAENRCNSRTAREVELALPSEVGKEGREEIARWLAEDLVNRYGVAVMVALHEPSKHGDDRNYHAHILFTTRRMEAEGLGSKTRELDDQTQGKAEILHIREYAAELINKGLEKAGNDNFIDHRSFKDRGIEQTPTEHLGVEAAAMERRGEDSRIGKQNSEIEQANQRNSELAKESKELDRQIAEARAEILEFKPKVEPEPAEQNKEVKPEPTAEKPETYWQDLIKAEREGEGDNEGGTTISIVTEATPENKSSINNHITIAHAEQIAKYGEIQHKGLVKSWVEHALEWVHDLGEDIAETWDIVKEEIKGGSEQNIYDTPDETEQKPSVLTQEVDEIKPAETPELQEHKASFWQLLIGKGKEAQDKHPVNEVKTPEPEPEQKPLTLGDFFGDATYDKHEPSHSERLDRDIDNDIER